jgi:hypothetical protein
VLVSAPARAAVEKTMSDFFKMEGPNCGQHIDCPVPEPDQPIACPAGQEQIRARPSSDYAAEPDFKLPPGFSAKETGLGSDADSKSAGSDTCLFQDADVTVTKTLIYSGGETFPVGAITSVKGVETTGLGGLLKSDFSVVLTTSSGEVTALTSQDKLLISRVIEAIRLAIVMRG